MRIEKGAVVQIFGDQGMRQAQHQRYVSIGLQGQPLSSQSIRCVMTQRADIDEGDTRLPHVCKPVASFMPADASLINLSVLGRYASEQYHQLTVFGDGRPSGHGAERWVHAADDVRNDHRGCTGTVIGNLAYEAAETVAEAIELRRRVIEHTGTRLA